MGPKIAAPHELKAPDPILDNSGKYMCPYTQDGVLAEWTDNAINAKLGATIGKTAGTFAGQQALKQVPFVGGMLGAKFGEEAGRAIAIESSGGMEFIKSSSDVSFNTCDDMSVYLYATYATNEHYKNALDATFEIYPDFKKKYHPALVKATKEQRPKK
jgi:hypothetical protein